MRGLGPDRRPRGAAHTPRRQGLEGPPGTLPGLSVPSEALGAPRRGCPEDEIVTIRC